MKKVLFLLIITLYCSAVYGQSILEVPAVDRDGNPIVNALTKYVVADTSDDGKQLHDIYKLQRGKYYFYDQSPIFNNPITLIADEPGNTYETRPPKLILQRDDAGEAPYEACITTSADLVVKNIAFSTTTVEGDYSWANVILVQQDGISLDLEGCIFELSGWGMIEAYVALKNVKVNKCHVRNGTVYDYGDEWCPFFLEISPGSIENLEVRNSTFFNLQGTVLNIEMQNYIGKFIFDHNTLVNVVKGFTEFYAHLNTEITNNIFYNVGAHNFTFEEIETAEDGINAGVITADTLTSGVMAEKDRRLVVKNNAFYFSKGVEDYWTKFSDILPRREVMDSRTTAMFNAKTSYPNFVEENNIVADPKFKKFGGTDGMVAEMINHRENGTFGFFGWDDDEGAELDEEYHWGLLEWPMPEDFSHQLTLKGTDGYHLGSLVYYPTELKNYYDNLSSVETIEDAVIPANYTLEQNYPNPFNPTTTIQFSVPQTGKFSLKVYDILGRVVSTLFNGELTAGVHKVNFDASKMASGVYFYRLSGENVNIAKKMILSK